ncbi:MAG TPA: retroviral-like aspartic protease family protein [Candidatus Acidoferrum sp.]|nr:retroviral-like aspartic protease family protein [Candidatus Acidoferrum sp.]
MGEVHVKARLTNAIDEALVRRGTLTPDRVRSCEVDAFVDTGASRTVLPAEVVERLGLAIRGQVAVGYADGHEEAVGMTEPLVVEIDGQDTADEALVRGDQVLIGQTVLEKLNLLVDSAGRRLIPNPRRPANRV